MVRMILPLFLALILSLLAGGMVVQAIAQAVRGDEVYIVAFVWVPVAACLSLAAMGLAGAVSGTATGLGRTALGLGLLTAAAGIGLTIWSLAASGGASFGREAPLIAAFVLPTWAVVLSQWWLLRRHRMRVAMQGGR